MLRFRMKMLAKENLMAKTSDIGSCLGLLSGKLLIVGFVVGAFSANAMDQEFSGYNHQKAQVAGTKYKKERDAFKRQAAELQEQLLAAQSAPKTPSRIEARRRTMIEAVTNPQTGEFGSPLGMVHSRSAKTPDARNLVKQFQDVELTGDDASDFLSFSSVLEVYVQKKTSSSVTTVARLGEERSSEPTDLNDILKLFKVRLAGIIGPDFLKFYTNEFDVLVVARNVTVQQLSLPTDFKAFGNTYIERITEKLLPGEKLHKIVSQYRSEPEFSNGHKGFVGALNFHMQKSAEDFVCSKEDATEFEKQEELRNLFFKATCYAFTGYMKGNNNQAPSTSFGRGRIIEVDHLEQLNQELTGIFYSRPEGVFKFKQTIREASIEVEFGAGTRWQIPSGGEQRLRILDDYLPKPVADAFGSFLSCLAPALIENESASRALPPAPSVQRITNSPDDL